MVLASRAQTPKSYSFVHCPSTRAASVSFTQVPGGVLTSKEGTTLLKPSGRDCTWEMALRTRPPSGVGGAAGSSSIAPSGVSRVPCWGKRSKSRAWALVLQILATGLSSRGAEGRTFGPQAGSVTVSRNRQQAARTGGVLMGLARVRSGGTGMSLHQLGQEPVDEFGARLERGHRDALVGRMGRAGILGREREEIDAVGVDARAAQGGGLGGASGHAGEDGGAGPHLGGGGGGGAEQGVVSHGRGGRVRRLHVHLHLDVRVRHRRDGAGAHALDVLVREQAAVAGGRRP